MLYIWPTVPSQKFQDKIANHFLKVRGSHREFVSLATFGLATFQIIGRKDPKTSAPNLVTLDPTLNVSFRCATPMFFSVSCK